MTRILTIIWFLAAATFAGMWLTQTHLLLLEVALPVVMLALSFSVFRNLRPSLRRAHNVVVGVCGVGAAVGAVWLVLFGREQSSVGAFFLVYLTGIAYVLFIVALSLWAVFSRSRDAKET